LDRGRNMLTQTVPANGELAPLVFGSAQIKKTRPGDRG
jgi:hypothetical protein